MIAMAAYASFVTFWPYNLTLSLKNYNFDVMDGGGWEAYFNSIRMAIYCAIFGTGLIFVGGYLVEKARGLSKFFCEPMLKIICFPVANQA